jgi:transposase
MPKRQKTRPTHQPAATQPPDPEVRPTSATPKRSAAQKARVLDAYDALPPGSPERGALLRSESIYTSQIAKWRQQRRKGALAALEPQAPGPKPSPDAALTAEVARLKADNARLQARLDKAELMLELQKKLAQLFGPAPTLDDGR